VIEATARSGISALAATEDDAPIDVSAAYCATSSTSTDEAPEITAETTMEGLESATAATTVAPTPGTVMVLRTVGVAVGSMRERTPAPLLFISRVPVVVSICGSNVCGLEVVK
jgi:hypothetical protein